MASDQIELAERIVRLETKLDFLIAQFKEQPPGPVCRTVHKDHDTRLASLEAWRNRAVGALVAFNIIFVLVIDKLKSWIWP